VEVEEEEDQKGEALGLGLTLNYVYSLDQVLLGCIDQTLMLLNEA